MLDKHILQAIIESFVKTQVVNWSITGLENIKCPSNEEYAKQYKICLTLLYKIIEAGDCNDYFKLIDKIGEYERAEKNLLDINRKSWSAYIYKCDASFFVMLSSLRNMIVMQTQNTSEFIAEKQERTRTYSHYIVNSTRLLGQEGVAKELLTDELQKHVCARDSYENFMFNPSIFTNFFELIVKNDLAAKHKLIKPETHTWVSYDEYKMHAQESVKSFTAAMLKASQPATTAKVQEKLKNECRALVPYRPNIFTPMLEKQYANFKSSNPSLNRLFDYSKSQAVVVRRPTSIILSRK